MSWFAWRTWVTLDSLKIWFSVGADYARNTTSVIQVGALGHTTSVDLDVEIDHVGNQSCLHDRAPIKSLDTKDWMSVPDLQYPIHTVTHWCQESNTSWLHVERTTQMSGTSLDSSLCTSSLNWSNSASFPSNKWYLSVTAFSKLCESF